MSNEKKYGIWEYMSEQHGITLLESDVHEIIRLARAEMEFPDAEEIERQYPTRGRVRTEDGKFKGSATLEMWQNSEVQKGIEWALNKVRNPYPKTIQFLRDDEDGVTSPQGYHKKLAENVYEWAKLGLPFFWDLCVNIKDGTEWICVPPIDGKEIKLASKHVYTDGKPEIKVSVEEFPKQFKVLTLNEQP